MALGYLGTPYNSTILPYSDEVTPIKHTGKKMAPYIMKEDGSFLNESLEIIKYVDNTNVLNVDLTIASDRFLNADNFLNNISPSLFNLLMPYYLNGAEFSEKDRLYFQRKKEVKRGPFHLLVEKRKEFISDINLIIKTELYKNLIPFFQSEKFTLVDLIIASHLWGLYLAYDFRISDKLHNYLQEIRNICNFNYDNDLWRVK